MISAIKYQWQVWILSRQLDSIERKFRPIREAEKCANANAPPWSSDEWLAKNAVTTEISKLETWYLLRKAAREKVPTPDDEDEESWVEARSGGYYLSRSAYAGLRAAIRKERNEKWDFRLKVLGLMGSTAVGIIGAMIGLVAALKK